MDTVKKYIRLELILIVVLSLTVVGVLFFLDYMFPLNGG